MKSRLSAAFPIYNKLYKDVYRRKYNIRTKDSLRS